MLDTFSTIQVHQTSFYLQEHGFKLCSYLLVGGPEEARQTLSLKHHTFSQGQTDLLVEARQTLSLKRHILFDRGKTDFFPESRQTFFLKTGGTRQHSLTTTVRGMLWFTTGSTHISTRMFASWATSSLTISPFAEHVNTSKISDCCSLTTWRLYAHSTNPQRRCHGPSGQHTITQYQLKNSPNMTSVLLHGADTSVLSRPVDPALHEQQQPTFLNQDVVLHVRPIYEHLTNPALLSRCLLGKTQNANESLHSVIWAKCPKNTFSGLIRDRFGMTLAVAEYIMDSLDSHIFLPALGCRLTSATTCLTQKRDFKRIKSAETAH
ncbi:hypothetical protein PoB_006261500 [Plakobranchus ocellatus]|uniref:Uncharacterized protein n=1 Tax=Plakobranchus ocellatus TaxID=259542 RepID=A0AAV4CWC9_9GAST|nr:hypothetical protein PoB_006261500 [Plakobranchus ocellatus]